MADDDQAGSGPPTGNGADVGNSEAERGAPGAGGGRAGSAGAAPGGSAVGTGAGGGRAGSAGAAPGGSVSGTGAGGGAGTGPGEGAVGSSPGEAGFSVQRSLLVALESIKASKTQQERSSAPRMRAAGAQPVDRVTKSGTPARPGPSMPRRGAPATLESPLARVLAPLRRRALGDSAVRWAFLALAGWAVAVSVLLAWSKVSPTDHVGLIAAGLGGLAFLMAAGAWAFRRPTVLEVARVADARLHLDERLASALFYAAAPGEMEARLRADAVGMASRRTPAEAFPLRRHRDLVAVALAMALVAVLLAITPNPQSATLARQSADRAATAQARKVVASARQRLGQPSSPEAEQLAGTLQAALSQLAKAGTPLASLVALSNLSRQLGRLDNASGAAAEAADAAAGEAMAGAPGTQSLSSDLANGNLKAAAADLKSLSGALSTLNSAQRQALAAALAKAAASAGYKAGAGIGMSSRAGANGTFAGGLAQASSALSAGHLAAAGQALKSAAGGATTSASAASLQQQLAADQAAVQNEEAKVASRAQADTGSAGKLGGGAAGRAARGSNQSVTGSKSGSQTGVPGGAQGSQGQGQAQNGAGSGGGGTGNGGAGGSGSGSGGSGNGGSGLGPGGNGQGGEGGPGRAKGPSAGATHSGTAASPSDQVYIAGQPGQNEQVVGEQVGAGGQVKTAPYQAVLPSFEKTALQDLGSHVVSPDDQGVVRNYFSSLGSGR